MLKPVEGTVLRSSRESGLVAGRTPHLLTGTAWEGTSGLIRIAGLVSSAVIISACGVPVGGESSGPLPAGPSEETVTIYDDELSYDEPVSAGRVVFRIFNAASEPHKLTILPLPEDMPPLAQQLRGSKRVALNAFAGVPPRQPGTWGTFAVNLQPNRRYALVCLMRDEEGESHARRGISAEFRTGGVTSHSAGDGIEAGQRP